MFCPQCSQKQNVDEVRFCSRCGLPLEGVAEAMSVRGGVNSVRDARRTALIGFGLVTLSAVFLLATLIIGTPEPSFVVQFNLLIALILFLSALGFVSYKFLVSPNSVSTHIDDTPASALKAQTTRRLQESSDAGSAIPAREQFAERASEAMEVNSVTEDTTNFLNRN